MQNNIIWHANTVTQDRRETIKTQRACVLWFTGLSAAGKSTLANLVENKLNQMRQHTYLLDGDNIRHGLNGDLGFSDAHRVENIRRITELTRLFVDAGLIVISALISPFRADRDLARSLHSGRFIEIYLDTPIEICEQRDKKGLYKKARLGQIANFTGIDSPYEPPSNPELIIKTHEEATDASVQKIINFLIEQKFVGV
jgi:adenylyl-sulfate kinase